MENIKEDHEDEEISHTTAREIMEHLTDPAKGVKYSMPNMGGKVAGTAPTNINAYSDGSLKHTKGHFWQVGGAGVWWPDRSKEDLSEEEKNFAQFETLKSRSTSSIMNQERGGRVSCFGTPSTQG